MNASGDLSLASKPRISGAVAFIFWVLTLIEVVAVCILMAIGFSRDYYSELSTQVIGHADPLFNSALFNIIANPVVGYLAMGLVVGVVLKEFFIKPAKTRFWVNSLTLLALLFVLGLTLPKIFSAIPQ